MKFYHATRIGADSLMESFRNGIHPIGEGEGGQRDGFFVYTSQTRALGLAADFQKTAGQGCAIEIAADMNPDEWDFDYEQEAGSVLKLLAAFRPQLEELKGTLVHNRKIKIKNGESGSYKIRLDGITGDRLLMTMAFDTSFEPVTLNFSFPLGGERDVHYLQESAALQHLCDHMAEKLPAFATAKRAALIACASQPSAALKYIGTSPLMAEIRPLAP